MSDPTPDQPLPPPQAALAFLAPYHPPETAQLLLTTKLNRPLPLHATPRDLRRAARPTPSHSRPQPLTAKQKRQTKCHQLPRKGLVYDDFSALRELWLGYARELLGMGGGAPGMAQRLANGDLHGAVVEVVRCTCVDRVGVRGMVLRETKGGMEVLGQDGRVRILGKEGTVFRVEVPVGEKGEDPEGKVEGRKMVFEIYGSQMVYRSGERAGRKFKMKPMRDL